jgi:hypothetical protein
VKTSRSAHRQTESFALRLRGQSVALCLAPLIALTSAGVAQTPINDSVERIDLRRPEAWAMAYFGAAMMPSGWSLQRSDRGFSAALELDEVPHLDQRQRRIGFDGIKLEDLNRSPVFGRAWLVYGLPASWTLAAGWTPPIRIKGAKANELWSLTLSRRFDRGPWRFGMAFQGGRARIEGAFTCYDELIGDNPGDCIEPSRDEYRNDWYGVELGAGYARPQWRLKPGLSFAYHRLDAEVQVRASLHGLEDRARLITDGHLRTFGLGVDFELGTRLDGRVALTYTPLRVKRRDRENNESDDLTQLRLSLFFD